MKKILFCLAFAVQIVCICNPLLADSSDLITRKRVAVAQLSIRQNKVLHGRDASDFADAATEKIINAFAALKRFTILDRTVADKLKSDNKKHRGGYKVGASKDADIFCTGDVQNVSVSGKYDDKGKLLGYDGDVELQIKIYDLSTGTLLLSKDVRGGTEIGGGVLSLFNLYQDTPSKAVFKALNNAERRIKDTIEEAFPVEGRIVEIIDSANGEERFLISLGSDLGFRKGDEVMVIEESTLSINNKIYPRKSEIGRLKIKKIEPDGTFSEAKADEKCGQVIIKKYEAGYKLVLRSTRD